MNSLSTKIADRTARVVVMGVGYVGLPLVLEFARAGFHVTGLDRSVEKIEALRRGSSYISDVTDEELAPHVAAGRLTATTDESVLAVADAIVVCVPTPLNKTKDPDMRFIVEAAESIAKHQHPGMLIVLESTTYPGTTQELLVPKLTGTQFKLGEDVFIAFSPERVDPGNRHFKTRNTPKVLGGASAACLQLASALYSQIIDRLVPVSSTQAAEMSKLLENTFRAVNIALVNEVALMCRHLGVDPFEIIRAAATKPFGFMPFYPGPGLGGHCIPIDPLYLSWKLRTLKYRARFIELADAINSGMPDYVIERATQALNDHEKAMRGSQVLVYGMAYKPDVSDARESPAVSIVEGLRSKGAKVAFMDPYVPSVVVQGETLHASPADTKFSNFDLVIVVTDHAALERQRLLDEAHLIVDTRDALRDVSGERSHVYSL